jgi:hypothetical protein
MWNETIAQTDNGAVALACVAPPRTAGRKKQMRENGGNML